MPRVVFSVARHKQKKRLMNRVEGYMGARGNLLRQAQDTRNRAERYSFRDRKVKKRLYRKLWIVRINAAVRAKGISYSKFMAALVKAKIALNRKSLAEMAISDPQGFEKILEMTKPYISKEPTKK